MIHVIMESNLFVYIPSFISVRYEYFDFHHECRKMRWDRLSLLTDRLGEDIKRFGYESFPLNMAYKTVRLNVISLHVSYNESYMPYFFTVKY